MNSKAQIPKDLIAIVIFTVLSVIFIVVPPLNETPVRMIVGFPLVLFLPGYALICALFPRRNEMDAIERITLSIGLSIVVIVIIGLVLNYTPGGIRLGPILLAISSFILIFTAVATARRKPTVTKYENIPVDRSVFNLLLLILLYGFLSHLYFSLRYSGLIAGSDTGLITKTIQAVQDQSTIFTTFIYASGFGFQVAVTFLSNITSLSIQQLLILPTGFLYVPIAYLLFVELIKNKKTALFATFLLSLQPDLLFVTSRGSHERFTFFLALMALFVLVKLVSLKWDNKKFVSYLTLFYLTIFSLTAFNNWFSVLIIASIIFVSLIGFLFSRLFNRDALLYRKSLYIIGSCIPLHYYISFYVYPPSRSTWNIINMWREKLTMPNSSLALLGIAMSVIIILAFILGKLKAPIMSVLENYAAAFSKKIHTSKTYRTSMYVIISFVLTSYIIGVYMLALLSKGSLSFSPFTWIFLTLFNWITFPLSVIMVSAIAWGFIRERSFCSGSHPFLLLFYVSFSLLLLVTIFLDRVIGTGIGNNLELRVFPYFMFFTVALASITILGWMRRLRTKKWQKVGGLTVLVLIVLLGINSLLKSTNDPAVSNTWMFYSLGEKNAMNWIESNLKKATIWKAPFGRIESAFRYNSNFDSWGNISFSNASDAKYYLISDVVHKRANEYEYSLPSVKNSRQIYDNGAAELYQRNIKSIFSYPLISSYPIVYSYNNR